MDQYPEGFTEKDALCLLNTLPRSAGPANPEPRDQQLQIMKGFMKRIGLSVEDLDPLNIIHVTGTKGKGSTCAFTEQILRSHGFRTGFYSSPHLVDIRERIRINGQPAEKELFYKHFLQVFKKLDETKDAHDGKMPKFPVFFTLVAFRLFSEEKVDVAIIEVLIGGQNDCTNVIRRPWVCGVSSLGIDHTQLLGNTIEQIAWHKGGIFKTGVPAFTVKQPENAMPVLRKRAKEIRCPLWVCPDLEDYPTDCGPLRLSLSGKHQHLNASLALQLSHSWLQRRSLPDNSFPAPSLENTDVLQGTPFKPSAIMVKGLAETVWLGRFQILKRGDITYFLDGAHTMRSVQACADWFKETSAEQERNASGPVTRVLLFNISRGRDSAALLKLLVPCDFECAVFCPNIPDASALSQTDQWYMTFSVEDMMRRCLENEKYWRLHNNLQDRNETQQKDSLSVAFEQKADTLVFPCILSALQWITQGRDPMLTGSANGALLAKPSGEAKVAPLCASAEIHILITGNIRIVGGALKILDPESYE